MEQTYNIGARQGSDWRIPRGNHIPVLLKEVVEALQGRPQGRYIDCTVGLGGHALALLEAAGPTGRLLGLDADPAAIDIAGRRLTVYQGQIVLVHENYTRVAEAAKEHGFLRPEGVLMDLGLSSNQLEAGARGFSFQRDGPLDMRFDPGQHLTVADIVNDSPEEELTRIIARYGEEPRARRVSRALVNSRPINSTLELSRIIVRALGRTRSRLHPATRTFQSLRIAVNGELEALEVGLNQVIQILGPGGRLAVISYHSLEDRLVKVAMRQASLGCICPPKMPACICGHVPEVRLVTRKPITPTYDEVQENPRSRSARLRVAGASLEGHRPSTRSTESGIWGRWSYPRMEPPCQ